MILIICVRAVISVCALDQSFATCRFQCRASKGASSGLVTRWACMPDGMGNARRRPEGCSSAQPSAIASGSALTLLPNSQPPASFSPRPARPNKTLVPPPHSPSPHSHTVGGSEPPLTTSLTPRSLPLTTVGGRRRWRTDGVCKVRSVAISPPPTTSASALPHPLLPPPVGG
jgi:hypothetical protein